MQRYPQVGTFLGLVAFTVFILPIGANAARPFPDTSRKILIFNDQLPSQLTEAQWRFVARHYVGSQKQTRSWTEHMRRLNPAYLMLHYQLAVGTGPAPFVDGNRWVNDFSQVSRHNDWFLRSADGRRLHQRDWDWYVMDIRFRKGKPITGFPAYWVRTAVQRMRDNAADGCFADSYTQDILMGQLQPPFDWFSSAESNRTHWLPQLNQYGAYCTRAFHRQRERLYYLPNLGGLVTTWDRYTNFGVGDGGMNEGFCASGPGRYYSVADWKLQMTHLLRLSRAGKILLLQTATDAAAADHRWFIVGSYLLVRGHHTYLNMMSHGTLEWYPEYRLDLGRPLSEPAADVSSYHDERAGVFRREYQKGTVLVNPGDTPRIIGPLPAGSRVVSAEGGGAVGPDGREPGQLRFEPLEATIVIPPHSARVILRPSAPAVRVRHSKTRADSPGHGRSPGPLPFSVRRAPRRA